MRKKFLIQLLQIIQVEYLMQRGEVDMCIVGTDRTIATGDVAK